MLEAFSRALGRELHNLQATDLDALPAFVFQQLYNRLQWTLPEGAVWRAADEAARRSAPGRPAWFHLRSRPRESTALLRTFAGHEGTVQDCAFSPDGRRLVSGGDDCFVKLWDAQTGECLSTLEEHVEGVSACAWSPDGRFLASGDQFGSLAIWDVGAASCESLPDVHDGAVRACAFSPDGRRLVTASEDRTLMLWDVETGSRLAALEGHTDDVRDCSFSPDGRRILSAGDDKSLGLWDAETGVRLATLLGHDDRLTCCAFSPDGARLLSGGRDTTLRLWDAETGDCLKILKGHSGVVSACAFSPDGRRLVSGSEGSNDTLKLWDAETEVCLATLEGHLDLVTACAFSPDGLRIASAGWDGTLKLWDAATAGSAPFVGGHDGAVRCCAFSPDGRGLLSAGKDGRVVLWDREDRRLVPVVEWQGGANCCAFSPDGQRCVTGRGDGMIEVLDATTGRVQLAWEGRSGVVCCAFSPDGRRLVTGGGDGTLEIWREGAGELEWTLEGHSDLVRSCAFSPDGRLLVSASHDRSLRLWDTETGAHLATLKGHGGCVAACAFSPDGRLLVSGSEGFEGRLLVWDVETGGLAATLGGRGAFTTVRGCAFTADGVGLVAASEDCSLGLWDAQAGIEHARLLGPFAFTCLVVHPTGSGLACGDAAGAVTLVDVRGAQWGDVASSFEAEGDEAPYAAQCPHCLAENESDALWCSSCGRDLEGSPALRPGTRSAAFPGELFEECEIVLVEDGDGFGVVPPGTSRRRTQRVIARELPGGLIRLAHRYLPIEDDAEGIYRSLLYWSFRADYVKAALAPGGDILIAVDLPAARLTPEGLYVLCQTFFELEEVPLEEFVEPDESTGYAVGLARSATAAVAADDQPDWERLTELFSRAGVAVWQQDFRHGFRVVLDGYELLGVINWDFGRIEVIGQVPEAGLTGEAAFTRLLQLNHAAEVAACGLDRDGILRLSYHVPALTEEMPGHVVTQFAALITEVGALGR